MPCWYTEASAVLDLDGDVRPLRERLEAKEMDVTIGADGFSHTREGDTLEGFKLSEQV